MTGIRTTCQECGAPLDARNITGLCRECKLIVRNRRLSSQLTDATDPVSHREAITTVTWFLGGLRRTWTFRPAILRSIPLIAATHVPIIIGSGWLVGALAVVTAAVTCLPLSYSPSGVAARSGHRPSSTDSSGRGRSWSAPTWSNSSWSSC